MFGNNNSEIFLPTKEDLEGTVKAIIRLQETFELDTHDFADGIINGIDYGTKMSASDCYTIGYQAFNLNLSYHSELWIQESLKRLPNEKVPTVSKAKVIDVLANLASRSGRFHSAIELAVLTHQHDAKELQGLEDWQRELIQKTRDEEQFKIKLFKRPEKTNKEQLYDTACKGQLLKSPAEQMELKCRYMTNNVEFLKIAPFKVEEVNIDPPILIFRDVIYDREIDELKVLARPKLKRAGIQSNNASEPQKAIIEDIRISQNAWLGANEYKVVAQIHKRIQDMTGLNMNVSEPFQMGNYGVGGHYHLHTDYFIEAIVNPGTGNRISTVLFYVSYRFLIVLSCISLALLIILSLV